MFADITANFLPIMFNHSIIIAWIVKHFKQSRTLFFMKISCPPGSPPSLTWEVPPAGPLCGKPPVQETTQRVSKMSGLSNQCVLKVAESVEGLGLDNQGSRTRRLFQSWWDVCAQNIFHIINIYIQHPIYISNTRKHWSKKLTTLTPAATYMQGMIKIMMQNEMGEKMKTLLKSTSTAEESSRAPSFIPAFTWIPARSIVSLIVMLI